MGKPFEIEHIGDMFRLLGLERIITDLTDDTKHQVALNGYELDVFSVAGLRVLCPHSQKPGGQCPPAKIENFWRFF